jgi:long-chain acyl-CoA synthetase
MTLRSLAELSRRHGEEFGDSAALYADSRCLTYGELDLRSNQIAHALNAASGGTGRRVAFLGKNCAQYFVLLAACAKVGAVMVPLNWRLAYPELAEIVIDAEAAVVIVDDEFEDFATRLAADPRVSASVRTTDTRLSGPDPWYGSLPASDPGGNPAPSDIALQLYTSGTTGRPKGVMSTHSAVLDSLRILASVAGIRRDSVSLCTLPTFHIGGTSWTLTGLWAGCPTVLLRESTLEGILDAIASHAVTNMIAVPAVIRSLLEIMEPDDERPRTLERLYYGGGPVTGPVLEQALATFSCEMVQGFGLTELPLIMALPPECHVPGSPLLGSCGRLVPDTEARIVDPTSHADRATGEVGELWVRASRAMSGYWKQDSETASAFLPGGWLRTGDAMHVDSDGYYFLHDRIKDVIISGGENIYSAEVENVLMAHPSIRECAVIGVPSPRWSETVKAIIVLRPSCLADEDDIISFCRHRLATYKCPTSVDFVAQLPRTPSGKVQKNVLREPYWAAKLACDLPLVT